MSRKPDSENLTLNRDRIGITFANFNVDTFQAELLPNVHKSRAFFLGSVQLLLKKNITGSKANDRRRDNDQRKRIREKSHERETDNLSKGNRKNFS